MLLNEGALYSLISKIKVFVLKGRLVANRHLVTRTSGASVVCMMCERVEILED